MPIAKIRHMNDTRAGSPIFQLWVETDKDRGDLDSRTRIWKMSGYRYEDSTSYTTLKYLQGPEMFVETSPTSRYTTRLTRPDTRTLKSITMQMVRDHYLGHHGADSWEITAVEPDQMGFWCAFDLWIEHLVADHRGEVC